jgi:hypothetical protein
MISLLAVVLLGSCAPRVREIQVEPVSVPDDWWAFTIPPGVEVATLESPKDMVRYACVAAILTSDQVAEFVKLNELTLLSAQPQKQTLRMRCFQGMPEICDQDEPIDMYGGANSTVLTCPSGGAFFLRGNAGGSSR